MIELPVLLLFLVALALGFLFVRERLRSREAALALFERWRERELTKREAELTRLLGREARAALERWKLDAESKIREDAVRRSQAAVSGKTAEQLVPLLPDFPFDPRDARFLGSPIDLVVFDGMSAESLREIVFLEVKTGSGAGLSRRERRIRDAVLEGRVRWQELRLAGPGAVPEAAPASLFLPLRAEGGDTVGQLEVLPDAGEIRYWSEWTDSPIAYRLAPDVLRLIEGRRHGLVLATDGPSPYLRLDDDAHIEVDAEGGRLTLCFGDEAAVDYVLEAGRVVSARGALVLELDGGR